MSEKEKTNPVDHFAQSVAANQLIDGFGESKEQMFTPNWRHRLGHRLCPAGPYIDEVEHPWVQDCLHLNITVRLRFIDRIRIFFSGHMIVRTKTSIDQQIMQHETRSALTISPPKFLDPYREG